MVLGQIGMRHLPLFSPVFLNRVEAIKWWLREERKLSITAIVPTL